MGNLSAVLMSDEKRRQQIAVKQEKLVTLLANNGRCFIEKLLAVVLC